MRDGHYLLLQGHFPKEGETREVRYRLYDKDLVSNVGRGLVSAAEIARCRGDSFAVRFGDFKTVAAIADGRIPAFKRDHIDVRPFAVKHLRRFKNPPCVMLLERLLRDKDEAVRRSAVSVLEELAKGDSAVRAAAQRALANK